MTIKDQNLPIFVPKLMEKVHRNMYKKVGILGGGQLGKMLCSAAQPWHLMLHILDKDKNYSAPPFTPHFIKGDFSKFDDVYAFGKDLDVLTVEIEHVNVEALEELEAKGVAIHPNPRSLRIIQDKGLQKNFYKEHEFTTSPYRLFADKQEVVAAIEGGLIKLPFVQKSRTMGYDGKGVQVIKDEKALDGLLDAPCVIEELVDIKKELSVIVARNPSGAVVSYPPVEMVFDPTSNLVSHVLSPANIEDKIAIEARKLAERLATELDICGLLAVELFLDQSDRLLINEVAPRPHNSGHHTIEGNITSQFEQHLRAILDWPLGDTAIVRPAMMYNLVGSGDNSGKPIFEGFDEVLEMSDVHIHWYGKEVCRPNRKMGHITILGEDEPDLMRKLTDVKRVVCIHA